MSWLSRITEGEISADLTFVQLFYFSTSTSHPLSMLNTFYFYLALLTFQVRPGFQPGDDILPSKCHVPVTKIPLI